MPPRRARPAPPPAPKPAPSKRPPVSKFAKELGLSAQEETEIKEAFEFFAHTDRNSDAEHSHDDEDEDDEDDVVGSNSRKRRKVPATKGKGKQKAREEEKVLPTDELRNALKALGFEFDRNEMREIRSAVDPDNDGVVTYESFLGVCGLKMKHRDRSEEIEKAFALFTGGEEGPITIEHLRKVAKEIREEATDEDLMDMLREASGRDKVNKKEFEEVMMRAGAI